MEIQTGMSAHGQQHWAEYLLPFLNPMDPRNKDVEGYKSTFGSFAGIPAWIPGARAKAPNGLRDKAIQEFRSTLRGLVDRWIESGRQSEGEQPWARSVRYGEPESIEITLVRFWKRHPPRVQFDGEAQVISTQSLIRQSDWVHLAAEPQLKILEQSRDYAIGLFAPILDSASRYRIFKCAECHAYFTRKRMPRKGIVIKGGSYCEREQCESAARKRRVYDGRGERLARMVELAADAWLQWKPGKRYGERAIWVVRKVNESMPSTWDHIAKNWVTRHMKKIEAEVERRKHAKG